MSHQVSYTGIPTPSSSNARSRRTQASSEEDSPFRPFGISNVKFRVGAPPLRPLPLDTSYDLSQIEGFHTIYSDLIHEASKILSSHGILDPEVDMVTRKVPEAPTTGEPTLFVVAKWEEESAKVWERAVKEIKRHLDEKMFALGRPDVDICVEIVAPELTMDKYISIVPNNPSLVEAWPAIKDQVYRRLESFSSTKSTVTAISLVQLGYSQNTSYNPATVYVSLDYNSDETGWPPVVAAIENDLALFGWSSLKLHVEHNVVQNYSFELVPPSDDNHTPDVVSSLTIEHEYTQIVNMGADISAARYVVRDDQERRNPSLGTLGCYVEIKTSSKPTWTQYALTNHHVVRPCFDGFSLIKGKNGSVPDVPVKGTTLFKTGLHGMPPSKQDSAVDLESPSRLKHNFTINRLNLRLGQRNPTPSAERLAGFQEQKDRKTAFFDRGDNVLGRLWVSSGFGRRTPANSRLDWALIAVNATRQGQNILPSEADWKKYDVTIDGPWEYTFGALLQPQAGVSLKTMSAGTKVFKVGARTQASVGTYSNYKPNCWIADDKYMKRGVSSEVLVMGLGKEEFANRGDSGAVVFDEQGRVIGLLFSGQKPQQTNSGYALVTPIEDVFQDIKNFSNQAITDIRIAQG
ncbi:hypothetical protein QQX98_011010 [Neonectria punicea]|uniref:Uncharacterized protein n=1 Tax=Neonectria punicea TaxID=979145 RepID=A0ABR1GNB4_9HYPO